MDKAKEYIELINSKINRLLELSVQGIHQAAQVLADTLQNNKTVYVFGTGHSHMFAEELFYRAGGLAAIHPILETPLMLHDSASSSTKMERMQGYASIIAEKYGFSAGDLILIASNSGRNGVCIELALEAKKLGLTVLVLTNMKQAENSTSRHPSGKLLHQCADLVLDNLGDPGDAAISIEGLSSKISPTSTVMGSIILNAVVAQAVQIMINNGYIPEVFRSSNLDDGDKINEKYIEKYKKEIHSL
jgi:uncharacterized phosphosugar-binding protein